MKNLFISFSFLILFVGCSDASQTETADSVTPPADNSPSETSEPLSPTLEPQESTTEVPSEPVLPSRLSVDQVKKAKAVLDSRIDSALAEFEPVEKAAIQIAIDADPFPNQQQLLLGPWHGNLSDPEYSTFWFYERHADGTLRSTGLDLETADKMYNAFDDDFVWTMRGRVIFELNANDPEYVDMFIIKSINEQEFNYVMPVMEESLADWTVDTDSRGVTKIPAPPAGWKKMDLE